MRVEDKIHILQQLPFMPSSGESTVSKCSLCFLFLLALLLSASAVCLAVLLLSWGNAGFMGTGSITLGSCSQAYYSNKYSNLKLMSEVTFMGACLATFASTLFLLITISWVCKSCSNSLKPQSCSVGCLFFLVALALIGAIPPTGYYLSFLVEINRCSNSTMDLTQTVVTLLLAAGTAVLAILLMIAVLCVKTSSESQEKYRQVETTQTEPNVEKRLIPQDEGAKKNFEGQRSPLKVKEEEYTREKLQYPRQNLHVTPSKRRMTKDIEPVYLERNERRDRDLRDNILQERRSPYPDQERIASNLHPNLRNIDIQKYVQNAKYKKYPSSSERQQNFNIREEEQKYYDDDRRGILSRGGFEERDRRPRHERPEYNPRDNDRYENDRGYPRGGNSRNSPQRREREDDYEDEYPYSKGKYLSPDRGMQREGVMRHYARRGY